MISSFWNTVVYEPLYNILILLVDVLPGHSVGGAIILLTILVKLALYPLSAKAIQAQQSMRKLEPALKKIKEDYKRDKQKQAEMTMRLYQEHGVTPFGGCLPLLVQVPIIIALYWIFLKGIAIKPELLYGFIPVPETLDLNFLSLDLAAKSTTLAALAGITQYIQADLSLGKTQPDTKKTNEKPSFAEDFQKSMQIQIRYVFPVLVSFIAYTTSAAVALYWATSNILSIAQEYVMRKNTGHNNHESQ